MEVAQFGPRELRVVTNAGWSLPVHCDPYTSDTKNVTHWSVAPAIPLLAAPFAELSKRFGPLNLGSATTFWVITNDQLEATTSRVAGCVPKDYLVWNSEVKGKESAGLELAEVNDKDEEFLRYCCFRSSIDMPLGRYVWRAIKEGMQHWLINNQKPIEFELFTIIPLPYRLNWKEIQLSKHLGCYKTFKKGRKRWHAELVQTGFISDLGSTDLISMTKGRTFNWSLEIVPSKLWSEAMKKAESVRLAQKGPVKYARYYESVIRRRFDDILTAFSTWMREVCNPLGSLRESAHSGSVILAPKNTSAAVSPNTHRPSATYFQVNDRGVGLVQGQMQPRRVSKTIKKMLDMPSVQPPSGDLRKRIGPSNDGGGASGLLLPDANESQAEGGGLLAEGERT